MIWDELSKKKPYFVLAPMDDVTDSVFRRIVSSCAKPDLFMSEFVSVDGLSSAGREALWKKLEFVDDTETPLIAQLWGLKPENYYNIAKELSTMGFAGIDINMGCPVPVVIKNGACSALINDRSLAKEIIQATIDGAGSAGEQMPVSVKTRLGFDKIDLSWPEELLEMDIAALSVHGRTTREMSKVPNHWDEIAKIVKIRDRVSPNTHIIGNGDILTRAQGLELAEEHGVDGLMIGRGVFQDPYVFAESSPWQATSPQEKIDLYKKHIKMFTNFWGDKKNPASLKKFAKVYINGFPGASELRSRLMSRRDAEGLLEELKHL